jgi:hypothetical protein
MPTNDDKKTGDWVSIDNSQRRVVNLERGDRVRKLGVEATVFGGFGCRTYTHGRAVLVTRDDGQPDRWNRDTDDIETLCDHTGGRIVETAAVGALGAFVGDLIECPRCRTRYVETPRW